MNENMKIIKIFFLAFIMSIFISIPTQSKTFSIYTQEKLYPSWFNPWGALDFMLYGYATLIITKDGGISIKDTFRLSDNAKEKFASHWITIDKVYRGEDWKDSVLIYATYHYISRYDGKEDKERGNGSIKFPPTAVAHIISGAASSAVVEDHYAQTHPTTQNSDSNANNHQESGNRPCNIDSRAKSETYLKFKKGSVQIKPVGCDHWVRAKSGIALKKGDVIKTSAHGRAEIVFVDGVIRLVPNSMLVIPEKLNPPHKRISFFKLLEGLLFADAKKREDSLKVATPNAICGSRGTKFEVSYIDQLSCVKVFQHSVWFSDIDKRETVIVHEGEKSCVAKDGLPSVPTPINDIDHAHTSHSGISDTGGSHSSHWEHIDPGAMGASIHIDDNCIAYYRYKGWIFSQKAKARKLVNSNGQRFCATAVGSINKKYYDWIKDLSLYRRGDKLVAVWFYRKSNLGKIESESYYYRCLERGGQLAKNSTIHPIPTPSWIKTHPVDCGPTLQPPRPLNIAGIWNTSFGTMTIKQNGDKISGTYTHDRGKIEGVIKGKVLVGKWIEAPTYKPRDDAGDVRLIFSQDGTSFDGWWRYGFGGEAWDGRWSGYSQKIQGGR